MKSTKSCERCHVVWSKFLHERVETNSGIIHGGCRKLSDKVIDRQYFGGDRTDEPETVEETPEAVLVGLEGIVKQGASNGDGTYNGATVFANINKLAAGVA